MNTNKYIITYQKGITDKNQNTPKTIFTCLDELDLIKELNKYMAFHTIYLDQITDIRRDGFNNAMPQSFIDRKIGEMK